jgi:acetyl esterase/lipase
MRRYILPVVVVLSILALSGCQLIKPTPTPTSIPPTSTLAPLPIATLVPTHTPLPQPTPTLPYAQIIDNVTYCTVDGDTLTMDLYLPKNTNQRPTPIVLNVHGGSWSVGDKKVNETSRDIPALVARGYIVAAVNYRHAPAHKFPAQIQDIKCAVRFLRAHATLYNIDPNRIGAFGCSAGGHLVSMLGLADKSAGYDDGGEYADYSSRMQAVIAMSAPTDLTLYNASRLDMLERVFGAKSMTDTVLATYSPINYITPNAPPFLVIGGDQDVVVPLQQSQELYNHLQAQSHNAQLVVVQNGEHCLLSQDMTMTPSRIQVTNMMVDFFDQAMPSK